MAYLTFDEYEALTGADGNKQSSFNANLQKASAVLDSVTNNFYKFNDLATDKVTFRANRFKQALCAQIDYFIEIGGNTFEAVNKAPQSFSLGRTNISNGSRYNASGQNKTKQLVTEDIYIYLEGTGLLYRGVARC